MKGPRPKLQPVTRPPARSGFYASEEWRRVRYQALLRSDGACDCCGNHGTREHPLHVDHVKPRARFPELALVLGNLQVLCADCNLGKGAWDQTDWRPEARA
jgi:5-methylcytosine-specific restriction endonuclease McrA